VLNFFLPCFFQDSNAYNAWAELKPSWVDFVTEFSSVRIPAGFYLTELPVLQPRYYSISNSPSMYPDQVHLTVGVLEYQVGTGNFNCLYITNHSNMVFSYYIIYSWNLQNVRLIF